MCGVPIDPCEFDLTLGGRVICFGLGVLSQKVSGTKTNNKQPPKAATNATTLETINTQFHVR